MPTTLERLDDWAFDLCSALKRVDIANPHLSLRGEGCDEDDDDGDGYICWGLGLPAAFGIRVPEGSGFTAATTGHFHDARKRRRAVPILGTSPVPVMITLRLAEEGNAREDVVFSRLSGETYGDALAAPVFDEDDSSRIFRGWYTGPNGTGERVTADMRVPATAVTLYPYMADLPYGVAISDDVLSDDEEGGAAFAAARTYDGYLYSDLGDPHFAFHYHSYRRIVGTIRVTTAAARTDRRTGRTTVRTTVKIQIPGERSVSLSGEMVAGSSPAYLSVAAKDGRRLDLVVGADALVGMFDTWGVTGGAEHLLVARRRGQGRGGGCARTLQQDRDDQRRLGVHLHS